MARTPTYGTVTNNTSRYVGITNRVVVPPRATVPISEADANRESTQALVKAGILSIRVNSSSRQAPKKSSSSSSSTKTTKESTAPDTSSEE